MSCPVNHKTVFVLDHSPHFARPCDTIELETKTASSAVRVETINKTIWTSATESVLEYARVVYDIFPSDADDLKLLRMVVCDGPDKADVLNSWKIPDQNPSALSSGLALVGPPDWRSNKEHDLRYGLTQALSALTELTPVQQRLRTKGGDLSKRIVNRGRIVLLAHVADKEHLKATFYNLLAHINQMTAASKDVLFPISEVDLDVVHCYSPKHFDGGKNSVEMNWEDKASGISIRVVAVPAGADLSKKLLCLALRHFDLASTTVTGIPMKEEQNASSSANYDVELFHKASAHTKLFAVDGYSATAPVDLHSWMPQTMKEGCEYKTVTLKWCTPRGNCSSELQHCITAARITPTDVNSRPSSCLTNFLLSGRSVMLEMPRRSGSKILSHMLTSHAGEIFIHTLAIARSVLDDPPSISEGPGGRVVDYRITDLCDTMKSNRLAPFFGDGDSSKPDPIDLASDRVSRYTLFCPMVISATTILNMSAITPLYNIMLKDEVTEENLAECRKVIYSLLSMENKGDPLPVPMTQQGGANAGKNKTPKKEEQYKMMFTELERFLAAHGRTERHQKVLDCLLEVRNRPAINRKSDGDKVDLDVALREIERYSMTEEKRGRDVDMADARPAEAAAGSRQPPLKRPRMGGQNLLEMFVTRMERETGKNLVPFAGMRSLGEKAKLYLSLEKRENESAPPAMMDM